MRALKCLMVLMLSCLATPRHADGRRQRQQRRMSMDVLPRLQPRCHVVVSDVATKRRTDTTTDKPAHPQPTNDAHRPTRPRLPTSAHEKQRAPRHDSERPRHDNQRARPPMNDAHHPAQPPPPTNDPEGPQTPMTRRACPPTNDVHPPK
ncbi:uncharacterized protein LACBIDRAFT_328373 [Laccaria bicolor S238N-H82]|uniref:Predicted protein n=1 Tax=Laccaria bicolor (strain S238N-H82 / ATCC MYA-4686) TaxID=486041 RepID=B0DEN7_LACBS|nr:uncharacterized protein LACBIDRAFT_328373 [Laccaria bicolor S238N-H82]EDR06971.1 predicted protein [Laccaria bicolor S238N-H82]|eukprot:XP_001882344.1 predicted protein [Laccaria bicolor S238N-H82]